MQRYLLRFSAALCAFAIGVSTTMLWVAYRVPEVRDLETQAGSWGPLSTLAPAPATADNTMPHCSAVRLIRGGVLQGKAISKPAPAYPPLAKAAGAAGTVVVEIIVDEAGRVSSAQAVSGHPLLQQAAVQAAYRARFTPTLLSGQPVKVSGSIAYNFVLQ